MIRNPTAVVNHKILIDTARITGRHEVVDLLLQHAPLDPAAGESKMMEIACDNKDLLLMNILLKYPAISPSVRNNEPFLIACSLSSPHLVRKLLIDKRVCPTDLQDRALRHTTSLEILKILWEVPEIDFSVKQNEVFVNACDRGDTETVKWLLTKSVTTSYHNKVNLFFLAFVYMLLKVQLAIDSRKPLDFNITRSPINPADNDNRAFIRACYLGHLEIVELLLAHPSVDPSDNNNMALDGVVKGCQTKIASLLLSRIDPSVGHCRILSVACKTNAEILTMLLNDPRIDPNAVHYFNSKKPTTGLLTVLEYGTTEAAEIFFKHPRVNVAIKEFEVVRILARLLKELYYDNYEALFKLIILDPRIDPSIDNDYLLRSLCTTTYSDLLTLLLQDSRVTFCYEGILEAIDARCNCNIPVLSKRLDLKELRKAFSFALKENNLEAVQLLAPQISIGDSQILEACVTGTVPIVAYLLELIPFSNFEDAIYVACSEEIARFLIEKAPSNMDTTLVEAFVNQKYSFMETLLLSPLLSSPSYSPSPSRSRNISSNMNNQHFTSLDTSVYHFYNKEPILQPFGTAQPWHKPLVAVIYEGLTGYISGIKFTLFLFIESCI